MSAKLIKLEDGIYVEVERLESETRQISSGAAQKVKTTLGYIKPILLSVAKPVVEAWEELGALTHIDQAEIELALSFEGEGNIYIAKGKTAANVTVKLVLKKPEANHDSKTA